MHSTECTKECLCGKQKLLKSVSSGHIHFNTNSMPRSLNNLRRKMKHWNCKFQGRFQISHHQREEKFKQTWNVRKNECSEENLYCLVCKKTNHTWRACHTVCKMVDKEFKRAGLPTPPRFLQHQRGSRGLGRSTSSGRSRYKAGNSSRSKRRTNKPYSDSNGSKP